MVISVIILIEFKSTHELAIDEARLAHSGFVASVCDHVRMQGIYLQQAYIHYDLLMATHKLTV